jgi:hypothetical protein
MQLMAIRSRTPCDVAELSFQRSRRAVAASHTGLRYRRIGAEAASRACLEAPARPLAASCCAAAAALGTLQRFRSTQVTNLKEIMQLMSNRSRTHCDVAGLSFQRSRRAVAASHTGLRYRRIGAEAASRACFEAPARPLAASCCAAAGAVAGRVKLAGCNAERGLLLSALGTELACRTWQVQRLTKY